MCILEGMISVEAAVKYKSRKVDICYVDAAKVKKRDRKVLSFLKLLRENNISAEICDREIIDAFLDKNDKDAGNTHGGIVAVCGNRRFISAEALLEKTAKEQGFSVVLDGIEDPFNLGYSVRNLYAAGVCGIFIPARNPLTSAGICARSSAGASEMCDIATLPQFDGTFSQADFVSKIKEYGISTVCAAKTADCTEMFSFSPKFPAVLFIGGEKRGISPEFVENCDNIVSIPYFSDARFSLPAASTAAILGFELARHRFIKK
ncbi:MAG: hypothetical protein IKV97_04685 [Clostridia bacterium]|nr:hypothetical protein [Clostridia bacterium]